MHQHASPSTRSSHTAQKLQAVLWCSRHYDYVHPGTSVLCCAIV